MGDLSSWAKTRQSVRVSESGTFLNELMTMTTGSKLIKDKTVDSSRDEIQKTFDSSSEEIQLAKVVKESFEDVTELFMPSILVQVPSDLEDK